MTQIDSFSLEKHEGPYEKWPRRTRLFFNSADTGTKIPGYIIEAQYTCADGYLLITSQDCPYEESNDFILLSPSFQQIARKCLLFPYESFLLHAHWPVSDDSLRLHHYESLFMALSVRTSWGIFGRKRRLVLKRFKNPENDPQAMMSLSAFRQRLHEISMKDKEGEGKGASE